MGSDDNILNTAKQKTVDRRPNRQIVPVLEQKKAGSTGTRTMIPALLAGDTHLGRGTCRTWSLGRETLFPGVGIVLVAK